MVVDDDVLITRAIARTLRNLGYTVDTFHDVERPIGELSCSHYDGALIDVRLGDRFGYEVVAHAAGLERPPALLMMSGAADAGDVIRAMRYGATDFLQKPIGDRELVARLERALDALLVQRKLRALDATEDGAVPPSSIAGNNAMRDALILADRVAATPAASALIVGESGVGKELIASRIHNNSCRRGGPFVRVNLAAISESVLEAELFGSVKGAFTDSKVNRVGHLATADGGTILLDEIGEFRIENQAKLLRVLEEHRFFPVGSDRERTVNVRVIAATNRDPHQMIERGLLREDLFYRLGSIIRIPPLRERADEIVPLAKQFLLTFCAEFGRPACQFAPATLSMLEGYAWPGNIRQLRNSVERAVMLNERDEITPAGFDLGATQPEPMTPPPPPSSSRTAGEPALMQDERKRALAGMEREHIVRALASTNGSRSDAAKLLGLSRSTLYEKLKRYDVG